MVQLKFDRSVLWLALIGIALRCVALNQPLLDAHNARQCQTAAATEDMIATPGFPLSAHIPWAGDIVDARYVQELPIYNYLAIAVYQLVGNVDMSGKLASIALWACSFFLLQKLWRRFLNQFQIFWANLLFVVAPLGVFYGQAFMPEMLIQTFSLAFILLAVLYDENPTIISWILLVGIGILGLLVKLPEFGHLYFLLAWLLVRKEKWKAFLRPRYLIGAFVTLLAIRTWGTYVDSVNGPYLPEWTSPFRSPEYLRVFIGTWQDRISLKRWTMVLLYLGAFVFPGLAALATGYGFKIFLRGKSPHFMTAWLISLVIFYLLWFGNGPSGQSYYNLPALAPLSALFGIGMNAFFAKLTSERWKRPAEITALLFVALPALAICAYLFQQERQTLAAANWIKSHTAPEAVILFRPNHHWAAVSYPYNAAMAHYSKRRTFVWTENTAELFRNAALQRAHYAVVTLPPISTSGALTLLDRFRKSELRNEPLDWLEAAGFDAVERQSEFIAYQRR